MRISVIGGGSWGTALAHHLARRGQDVLLWALEDEVAQGIDREHKNPIFLSDLELDPRLRATSDLGEATSSSETWVWVVPVQHSRSVMERLAPWVKPENLFISASKGIENGSLKRMDELAREVLGIPDERFCCLSGPTFAREVVLGQPSAGVLASRNIALATRLQHEFSDANLRFYVSQDLAGVELAAALKNVIAIAAGILDGLGLGSNTQAALLTRGLHEITRLAVSLGAQAETFRGLAGMGDLVLTCTGSLSRNRTVGRRLGQGESLEAILASTREVAEGVRTTPAAAELASRQGVDMPITEAMNRLLAGGQEPRMIIQELMLRELKAESEL